MEEQTFNGGEEFAELRGQGIGWFTREVIEVAENNRNKNRKNDNEPTARVLTNEEAENSNGEAVVPLKGGGRTNRSNDEERGQFSSSGLWDT